MCRLPLCSARGDVWRVESSGWERGGRLRGGPGGRGVGMGGHRWDVVSSDSC